MFLMCYEKVISTQNMLLSFRSHYLYTKGGAAPQAKLLIGPAIPTAYNQVVQIPGSLKSLAWLIVLLHLVCYNMSVHFAPVQNSASTEYKLHALAQPTWISNSKSSMNSILIHIIIPYCIRQGQTRHIF